MRYVTYKIMMLMTLCWCIQYNTVFAEDSDVLALTGVKGGLCLYFDCDEGRAKGIVKNGRFLLHALQSDAEGMQSVQQTLWQAGLAPYVCMEKWTTAPLLPYEKNHVNLVVAENYSVLMQKGLTVSELVRVLTPLGKSCLSGIKDDDRKKIENALKQKGIAQFSWKGNILIFQKPWPKTMGEWTHKQHGSAGLPVAKDTYMGVPNQMQWITGVKDKLGLTLVGAGRAFYFYKDVLIARDAGTGVILWTKDLARPPGKEIVLAGENILMRDPSSKGRPKLVLISGATGEVMHEVGAGGGVRAYENGIALVVASEISAYEVVSGKKIWSIPSEKGAFKPFEHKFKNARGNVPHHDVVMLNGRVYFTNKNGALICIDAQTGKVTWQRDIKKEMGADYAIQFAFDDKVLVHADILQKNHGKMGGGMMSTSDVWTGIVRFASISGQDGSMVWKHDMPALLATSYRGQVYNAAGRIWIGRHEVPLPDNIVFTDDPKENLKRYKPYKIDPDPMVFDGLNMNTGKIEKTWTMPKQINYHCYQLTVTDRYYTGNRPYYFVNWETGKLEGRFGALRTTCDGVGHFAAQGMFFTIGSSGCGCIRTTIAAQAVFSSDDAGTWDGAVSKEEHLLERGSAKAGSTVVSDGDWPMYRSDISRSGIGTAQISDDLSQLWHFKPGTADATADAPISVDWPRNYFLGKKKASQSVIVGNKVFVSLVESNAVLALDARTGAVIWTRQMPARADAPPAITKGLALVGCSDGWVYALNEDTGELVYRLRIAPAEKRMVAYGQLESTWPVVGGVLILGDMAYAVAGRTTEVDGGLYVLAFNPRNGDVIWKRRRHLNNKGDVGRADQRGPTYGAGGTDLLISDGTLIGIGDHTKSKRGCFDAKTGEDSKSKNYAATVFATPQSQKSPFKSFCFADKDYYSISIPKKLPKYKKQKVKNVSVGKKGGWSLILEHGIPVALSAGVNRLAVGVSHEEKNELWIINRADGKKIKAIQLPSKPTADGIAVGKDCVVVSLEDGSIVCFGGK